MPPNRPDPPINYITHPERVHAADGRPLPARPATNEDHHDHRHFPFVEEDCNICEEEAAAAAAELEPQEGQDG